MAPQISGLDVAVKMTGAVSSTGAIPVGVDCAASLSPGDGAWNVYNWSIVATPAGSVSAL